jgi:hypothetical protein
VRAVHDLKLPPGRGLLFNTALSAAYRVPGLDPLRPCLTVLEFG